MTTTTICPVWLLKLFPSTMYIPQRDKMKIFFCWTVSALPLLIWLMLSFYFSWLSTLEWILFYFYFFIYMIYVSIYSIFMKIMNSASMIRWNIFLQVLKLLFFLCCWLIFNFCFKTSNVELMMNLNFISGYLMYRKVVHFWWFKHLCWEYSTINPVYPNTFTAYIPEVLCILRLKWKE